MLIGYSVVCVNDDMTEDDALWSKRIVYSTWEKALDKAMIMANEEKNEYNDSYIISLVSSKSKNNCESKGNIQVFTVHMKECGEVCSVYIVPVYGE